MTRVRAPRLPKQNRRAICVIQGIRLHAHILLRRLPVSSSAVPPAWNRHRYRILTSLRRRLSTAVGRVCVHSQTDQRRHWSSTLTILSIERLRVSWASLNRYGCTANRSGACAQLHDYYVRRQSAALDGDYGDGTYFQVCQPTAVTAEESSRPFGPRQLPTLQIWGYPGPSILCSHRSFRYKSVIHSEGLDCCQFSTRTAIGVHFPETRFHSPDRVDSPAWQLLAVGWRLSGSYYGTISAWHADTAWPQNYEEAVVSNFRLASL